MRDTSIQSAQMGKRENVETTVDGRVMFDLLPYMFRNHKLSSYSLNSVCAEFLGMQKEDVHHSIISELQQGTDEDRRRLAVYCLKDSLLVVKSKVILDLEEGRGKRVVLHRAMRNRPYSQSVQQRAVIAFNVFLCHCNSSAGRHSRDEQP